MFNRMTLLAALTLAGASLTSVTPASAGKCTCNWGDCDSGYHCQVGGCNASNGLIGTCKKVGGNSSSLHLNLDFTAPSAPAFGTLVPPSGRARLRRR